MTGGRLTRVVNFTRFTVPELYIDEAMMASFQILANSSFTYPRIIKHYLRSRDTGQHCEVNTQNEARQVARNVPKKKKNFFFVIIQYPQATSFNQEWNALKNVCEIPVLKFMTSELG